MRIRSMYLLVVVAAVLFGSPSSPATAQSLGPRKVTFILVDNAYQPKTALKVRRGETVTFTFLNKGKVLHEALIGTLGVQLAHEKEMAGMGAAMAMKDESDRVTVKVGQRKTLTFKFVKPGAYQIACHQPKHYELGMKVAIQVI